MSSKKRASKVIGALFAGLPVVAAVAYVAMDEGVTEDAVRWDVRTTRYLVYHAQRPGPVAQALLDDLPDDVVPLPWGVTPEEEARQMAVLAELGVSISHLPSIFTFTEPYEVDDGEGGVFVVEGGWREHRLPKGAAWLDIDVPDRRRPLREWVMARVPPRLSRDAGPDPEEAP